jgi:type IV pilus assembly protein PilB
MILTPAQIRELVVASKLISAKDFDSAAEYSAKTETSLFSTLEDRGLATNEQLGKLEAQFLKLPFVNLSQTPIPEEVFNTIPERLSRKFRVIVFGRDSNSIKLAMSNPTQREIPEMIAKKTGQKVEIYYATKTDIQNTLQLFKRDLQKTIDILLKEDLAKPSASKSDDPPVAKIVDLLIDTAYEEKASDIHIEPQENSSVGRFRIDGMLQQVLTINKYLHDRIITRIKVLSNLRTDEHLSAQDGKMKVLIGEERVDIRVSIVPIAEGEKVVMRLLSSNNRQLTLTDLGMNKTDLEKVNRAYSKSFGMILSTGPTGSGKTTSIYAMLKILNTAEKNITTVEDPVEYRIPGANQIQVNTKTNLTFANGLRSILRQDPNVIFVGEIRDGETAGIAVNAALTGHLVLSTLHTNDAATALPRLIDMKVEPFLVASTVNVIIAQRLVRKICTHCVTSIKISQDELAKNFPTETIHKNFSRSANVTIYKGQGCKACRSSGYSGRVGLFEVLEITPKIRKLITAKNDSDVISKAAIDEGMTTMVDDGLTKVAQGVTTLEEVLRVTKSEFN